LKRLLFIEKCVVYQKELLKYEKDFKVVGFGNDNTTRYCSSIAQIASKLCEKTKK
jgi:hypothetical protein